MSVIGWLYREGRGGRVLMLIAISGILAFIGPSPALPQTNVIVYDGITGIHDVIVQQDTAIVSILIPDSPAEKAGIRLGDQIVAINDSLVSGIGMNRRAIKQLLLDRSGSLINLIIRREGEQSPLQFSFQRDPYLYQIDSYDYLYLVDSLEQWDMDDILSPSLDTLFKDPLKAKITVHSVEEGSPAAKNRILPGDQIISLAEVVDTDFSYHISYKRLARISPDTSIAFLRDDSLIYFLLLEPSLQGDFMGIRSVFEKDFSTSCVWLKFTTENRLAEKRTYLFNVPEVAGKDSLSLFYELPSGELVEKRSGILIPVQDRDFIYKDWHAFRVKLNKGEKQTFYLRWKAEDQIQSPRLQFYAHDTIVTFDRFERMVLFGFLVTMLTISGFFILLFVFMKRRQYLYFALYVGSVAVFLFITEGYLYEYFWKENNFFLKFLDAFQPYIMSWISIFFLLFGIAYLEFRRKLKLWYRSVVIVLAITGIRIVLVALEVLFNMTYPDFVERILTVIWIFTVGIIPLFILIPPTIIRIRKGFQPAWFFLFANLVLIPLIYVTLYSSLYSNEVITVYESIFNRIFITSGMYIAAILQIVIFSFGIAQKMRLDEMEKKQVQQQIIDQLKINEKLKDQVNRELEQKVKERTWEINEKKEEIEIQKKLITDSIDYARHIQYAVFPREEYLDQIQLEHFVLFRPKDIVSGDFYWIKEVHGSLIAVAADCTGHGVPGALMSMLGITLLNEQMAKSSLDDPANILNNLRDKIKEMLDQKGKLEEQKDGIEMGIAIIHPEKKELQFAGANNPLLLIRNKEAKLHEYKGDRQPIGFHWEEKEFTTHRIPLQRRDTVYLFTDGYIDQFGGEQRKKFKSHRFKELLLSVHKESMENQKKRLEEALDNWRDDIEQIDDICVIGIRI